MLLEWLRLARRTANWRMHIVNSILVTAITLMSSSSLLAAAIIDDADPEAVATQLRRGLGLRQSGDFARARTTFERVLRLENLPPDLHEQVEVYADAAQAWLDGRPAVASGYAVASVGLYREKDTLAGPGEANDRFGGLRIGGRVNVPTSSTFAMNASLDYRFRRYDDRDRRDDSDLRWALGGSRAVGDVNFAVGTRGWISARGDGITRNDAGVYGDLRWARGDNDQLKLGVELRRRSYPEGRLRERSRDIVQLNAAWTHAFADGRASFGLAAHGGREFAIAGNPYGDSNFIGLSPTLDLTFGNAMSGYVFGWWQRGRYNRDLLLGEAGDGGVTGRRLDDLFEIGAGLLWAFAPRWEVGPSLLYLHDKSSVIVNNYNSTEISLTLRRDF